MSCRFRRTGAVDIEQSFESNTRSSGEGRSQRRRPGAKRQGRTGHGVRAAGRAGVRRGGAGAVASAPGRGARRRRGGVDAAAAPPSVPPQPSRVGVCAPPAPPARPVPARREVPRAERGARRRRRTRPRPGLRPSARLRLTRRARRLAVVLALAAGVALGSWLGPLLAGGSEAPARRWSSVIVQSGDTLWSIATSLEGDGDVRATGRRDPAPQRPRRRRSGARAGPRAAVTAVPGPRGECGHARWRAEAVRNMAGQVVVAGSSAGSRRATPRQHLHNVRRRLRQPSVRARSHSVVDPAHTVVTCQRAMENRTAVFTSSAPVRRGVPGGRVVGR